MTLWSQRGLISYFKIKHMKKTYIALTMLLATSTFSSMGAKSEADFKSAKDSAIAKMTSWSKASPYAPEAFSKGLSDLENAGFSSYSDGDIAVSAVDEIVSATLAAAREELAVKMPTIFVTMTTDALTANPVDGGTLVGTPYEDRHYSESFKTYSKVCQGSAWLIFEQSINPGKYGMRNNIVHYLASKAGGDGEPDKLSAYYSYNMQPDINVDFADNGKMAITSGSRYIGTDETGGMAYYDTFSDATSWTFTRAYDEKCDLPRVSTEENPVWYMFRSAADPDGGFLTSRYPDWKGMILGPVSEAAMWRFGPNDMVNSDQLFCYNKNGSMLIATGSGHAEANLGAVGYPFMIFGVLDDHEKYGLAVCVINQSRFFNFCNAGSYETTIGCPWLLTKAPEMFSNQYTIDLSWQREEFPAASSCWFIEEASDAAMLDFLSKRNQYAAEVFAYADSQPWALNEIKSTVEKIKATEYSDYSSGEEANAAIRSMADQFLSSLPSLMMEYASSEDAYFSINNFRRMNAGNGYGWMLSTDAEGNFAAIASNSPETASTWKIEKATDTTFRLKNRDGYYIGSIRSGQEAKPTQDSASAATFSFVLSDGKIVLKSTRSSLSLDEADGPLTAAADTDPGAKWVLKQVVVMPDNDLVVSDISNQWLYTITSVAADPMVYLEAGAHRYYCWARDYLNDECYWYLERIPGNNAYRFVASIYAADELRMCRNPADEDGSFYAPVCYDKRIPTSDFAREDWYIIPVEYDGKRAYQISTCYPPKGNCCLSSVMENRLMTYSTVDDIEHTAWYFNHVEGIDHEGIFNDARVGQVAQLQAFLDVQPFVSEYLTSARDYVANSPMTEFGPDSYSSIPAMTNYVSAAITRAKWLLEEEPRGCTVNIRNVRRAENGMPSYLAAVDGHANTVDLSDETRASAAWNLEYYVNGCYRLKNDNGEYLGKLGSDIEVVSDIADAGLYFLDFRNLYMTLADRNNPDYGLNFDLNGGNACQYSTDDSGSFWTIELVRLSGVGSVSADGDSGIIEYYDLNGLPVSGDDLKPGLYIQRRGDRVSKILVK